MKMEAGVAGGCRSVQGEQRADDEQPYNRGSKLLTQYKTRAASILLLTPFITAFPPLSLSLVTTLRFHHLLKTLVGSRGAKNECITPDSPSPFFDAGFGGRERIGQSALSFQTSSANHIDHSSDHAEYTCTYSDVR